MGLLLSAYENRAALTFAAIYFSFPVHLSAPFNKEELFASQEVSDLSQFFWLACTLYIIKTGLKPTCKIAQQGKYRRQRRIAVHHNLLTLAWCSNRGQDGLLPFLSQTPNLPQNEIEILTPTPLSSCFRLAIQTLTFPRRRGDCRILGSGTYFGRFVGLRGKSVE